MKASATRHKEMKDGGDCHPGAQQTPVQQIIEEKPKSEEEQENHNYNYMSKILKDPIQSQGEPMPSKTSASEVQSEHPHDEEENIENLSEKILQLLETKEELQAKHDRLFNEARDLVTAVSQNDQIISKLVKKRRLQRERGIKSLNLRSSDPHSQYPLMPTDQYFDHTHHARSQEDDNLMKEEDK